MATNSTSTAFVSAIPINLGLESEAVNKPALNASTAKEEQLEVEAINECEYGIGLDQPTAPSRMMLRLVMKVRLRDKASSDVVGSYDATYLGEFQILGATIQDWQRMPHSAVVPYLAMLDFLARRRAVMRFAELGLAGVQLVSPDILQTLQPEAETVQASIAGTGAAFLD